MDKIIELIPEFYYDFIARIVPASVLILILIPFDVWKDTIENSDILISLSLPYLSAIYIVGFLLDAFSVAIEELLNRILSKDKKSIFEKLDEIKVKQSSKYFTKLIAEVALLRVLLTGWILIGISKFVSIPILKHSLSYNVFFYFTVLFFIMTSYIRWYKCTRKRIDSTLKSLSLPVRTR